MDLTDDDLQAAQQELLELRQQQALEIARASFPNFVRWVSPGYDWQWYHQYLADVLERVAKGELKRLIINMPPRHGKSEQTSKLFPAYLLGRNPDMEIISTSYSQDLASAMNRSVQRIIDSDAYRSVFPHTTLAAKNSRSVSGRALRNADTFEIVNHHGAYKCAGVGGAVTGSGGNALLVDDPIKNEEEARSITYRQKVWEWFTNTLMTRQLAGAAVVVIMTRWHEDDLVGRLLKRAAEDPKADQWTVITFPAIREDNENPDDPREVGEALWPDRYSIEMLEAMKGTMGEHAFAGLYQQRPAVAGGNTLKESRWRYWYTSEIEPPPIVCRDDEGNLVTCQQTRLPVKFDYTYQSWDMAFKDTARSDFVVGQLQGRCKADHFLLEQVRNKWDFPATVIAVRYMSQEHQHARAKLVEDKANGPAVISTLQKEIPGLLPIDPHGGKEARCNAIAPMQESGNLYIPHPSEKPWVRSFVAECSQFPKGKFDDQVDAYTQGVNWSYNKKKRKGTKKIAMVESAW